MKLCITFLWVLSLLRIGPIAQHTFVWCCSTLYGFWGLIDLYPRNEAQFKLSKSSHCVSSLTGLIFLQHLGQTKSIDIYGQYRLIKKTPCPWEGPDHGTFLHNHFNGFGQSNCCVGITKSSRLIDWPCVFMYERIHTQHSTTLRTISWFFTDLLFKIFSFLSLFWLLFQMSMHALNNSTLPATFSSSATG